jgi:hypothetical protein
VAEISSNPPERELMSAVKAPRESYEYGMRHSYQLIATDEMLRPIKMGDHDL